LLTGFAMPMPVVIDAMDYGRFCSEIGVGTGVIADEMERRKTMADLNAQVYGDDIITFD
jgi:hypothetical protein